jgi:hypothetical protein
MTQLGLSSQGELIEAFWDSPFPCEQQYYLVVTFPANGTTPNDFLAKQQCLCEGSLFDTRVGCFNCHIAHGMVQTNLALVTIMGLISTLCKNSEQYHDKLA